MFSLILVIVITLHLWLLIVAANPLTERTTQSLLTSSWSVHNPLVDETLRWKLFLMDFFD